MIIGVNGAWYHYGNDVGGGSLGFRATTLNADGSVNRNSAIVQRLQQAVDAGVEIVGWWIFPTGANKRKPAGIIVDSNNFPVGFSATVGPDVAAMMLVARELGFKWQLSLLNQPETWIDSWVTSQEHRAALAGLMEDFVWMVADSPEVHSIVPIVEVEFSFWNHGEPRADIEDMMVRLIVGINEAIGDGQLVISHSAFADGIGYWSIYGVDAVGASWYDYMNRGTYCMMCNPVSFYDGARAGKDVYVLESFMGGPDALERLRTLESRGYTGVFAWTLFHDRTGDGMQVDLNAIAEFTGVAEPDVNYVVKVHLLPQESTREQWLQAFEAAFPLRETILQSADDAARLVAPGLPGSKVVVWWPDMWADPIVPWLQERGVQLVETMPPFEPGPEPEPGVPDLRGVYDFIHSLTPDETTLGYQMLRSWVGQTNSPRICDQENQADAICMANALMAVFEDNATARAKAIDLIERAIGTEGGDDCPDRNGFPGKLLAANRNVGGYLLAAHLLDYSSPRLDAWTIGSSLESPAVVYRTLWQAGSANGDSIYGAAVGENAIPTNGGNAARASLLAYAIYMEDVDLIEEVANKFQDWLGRSGENFKWDPQASEQVWHASYPDRTGYRGVNPMGSTVMIGGAARNVDGVPPEDMKRAGALAFPFPKENYVYEGFAYALVTAWLLDLLGYPVWDWEDRALARTFRWLNTPHFTGNTPYLAHEAGDAEAPWLGDAVYGTNYRDRTRVGGPTKSGMAWWSVYYPLTG